MDGTAASRRGSIGLLTLLWLGTGGAPACRGTSPETDIVRVEGARVEQWLTPDSCRVTTRTGPTRSAMAVEQRWSIQCPIPWPSYLALLREHPPLGYERCAFDAARISCARSLPGDALSIEVDIQQRTPTLTLAALWRGQAN
jgi:hypothetical protein